MLKKPGSTDREIELACDRVRDETGREPRYRDVVALGIHAQTRRIGAIIAGTRRFEPPERLERPEVSPGSRPIPCCKTAVRIARFLKDQQVRKSGFRFKGDSEKTEYRRRYCLDQTARACEVAQVRVASSEGFYDKRGGERL